MTAYDYSAPCPHTGPDGKPISCSEAEAHQPVPIRSEAEAEAYRPEVRGVGESTWTANDLTFPTKEEALASASGTYSRWMGCDDYRAVPVSTPRNQPYDPKDGHRG